MRVLLKTAWRSPRGTLYPSGTIFIKNDIENDSNVESTWYDFFIPNESRGFVLIPDEVFKILTTEEAFLKKKRQELTDKHTRATKDYFLS